MATANAYAVETELKKIHKMINEMARLMAHLESRLVALEKSQLAK